MIPLLIWRGTKCLVKPSVSLKGPLRVSLMAGTFWLWPGGIGFVWLSWVFSVIFPWFLPLTGFSIYLFGRVGSQVQHLGFWVVARGMEAPSPTAEGGLSTTGPLGKSPSGNLEWMHTGPKRLSRTLPPGTRSCRTWRKGSGGQAGLVRKVALLSQPDAGGEMEEGVPRASAREKQGLVSVWGQLFNYCYRLN